MTRDTGVQLLPSPLKAICSLYGLHMSDVNLGGTPPAIMANTTHVFTQLFFWKVRIAAIAVVLKTTDFVRVT